MSRLIPPSTRISAIETTAVMLTVALRKKLCQAVLSAKRRCRKVLMVPTCQVVPDDVAVVDGDDPAAEHVDDVAVMGGHDHGRAGGVDPEEELHQLPGR